MVIMQQKQPGYRTGQKENIHGEIFFKELRKDFEEVVPATE